MESRWDASGQTNCGDGGTGVVGGIEDHQIGLVERGVVNEPDEPSPVGATWSGGIGDVHEIAGSTQAEAVANVPAGDEIVQVRGPLADRPEEPRCPAALKAAGPAKRRGDGSSTSQSTVAAPTFSVDA